MDPVICFVCESSEKVKELLRLTPEKSLQIYEVRKKLSAKNRDVLTPKF